jgi:hypothetical protein
MASKTVVNAVQGALGPAFNGIAVNDLNKQGEAPPDNSAFIEIQFPVSIETFIGMGGVGRRVFREEGTLRLVLSIPRVQGIQQGLDQAEQLRNFFRAQQIGGVTFRTAASPIIDNANDVGDYFVLSVSIPYFYDAFF